MSFGLNGLVFLDDAGWVGDDAGWVWSDDDDDDDDDDSWVCERER